MSKSGQNHFKKSEKCEKSSYDRLQNDFFKAIHNFIGKFTAELYHLERKQKEASLINQFISNIKKIFNFSGVQKEKEKEQKKLLGRIHELNKNAADVLKVLNIVRDDLKNEVDEDLYEFVKLVMNPMIRDISRIQKIVKKEGAMQVSSQHKDSAFNQYNQWIDRARLWVEVCSVSKNKDAISEAIIKHTFTDFIHAIERDLQLIEDYQQHILEGADLGLDEKRKLQKEIEKSLIPYLKSLNELRKYPENLTLENLNHWKDHSDKRRDRYFNAVLQAIDDKISKLNPAKSKMEELDVYMDHLEQISYLEMEIPLLIEKLENMSEGLFETELIFHQLLSLQDEIDNLYHDIRMPQEMIVRLQALRKLLKKTFSKFKNSSS